MSDPVGAHSGEPISAAAIASLACVDSDESELAALVAVAGLPHLAPGRFRSMLQDHRPAELWQRVAAGNAPLSGRSRDPARRWAEWAAQVDPHRMLAQHRDQNIAISWIGSRQFPHLLNDDPDPPVVLFQAGSAPVCAAAGVAVVGTRRCTPYGREVARELGARLAAAGVPVISGLAHGIDAATHAGAIDGGGNAVALVAGGVDVVYPRGNRELWHSVLANGCVASEYPLGAAPLPWRFPARNRLIAALSAMVVVVESPQKGGSMYTVDEALVRDRIVAAVPGSIRSVASAGTNRLIADGAIPLCSIDDLIDVLPPHCQAVSQPSLFQPDHGESSNARSRPDSAPQSWLLTHVGFDPVELDTLVLKSQRPPAVVALEVERLVAAKVLHRSGATIVRMR